MLKVLDGRTKNSRICRKLRRRRRLLEYASHGPHYLSESVSLNIDDAEDVSDRSGQSYEANAEEKAEK